MKIKPILVITLLCLLSLTAVGQDKSLGAIKGKVRVETGTPAGVAVIVKQGDREVVTGVTDKKGEFVIGRLAPGRYAVTFKKPGLNIGTIDDVEVKAGKTKSIGDNLMLGIDEGSIAFIRGSVFNQDGRSAPNVRVELARVMEDGTTKKIDGRVSNETGSFAFRLMPEAGKYRVTAKGGSGEPVSKDVEIDGAAVYRVALSLNIPK